VTNGLKGLKNQGASDTTHNGGGNMIDTGASGAIPRSDIKRQNEHAKLFYEEVRKRTGDIEKIAKNTGFSTDDIKKVKEHIFINEYDLGWKNPSRFDPDYDMTVSWQRLTDGKNIQEMDLVMLKHELMEYELMLEKRLSYREAHEITELKYDYSKYIKELNLKEGLL
jgi:hypothetical protein